MGVRHSQQLDQTSKACLIGAFQPINPMMLARDKLSMSQANHFNTCLFLPIPYPFNGNLWVYLVKNSTNCFVRGLKPHIRQEIDLCGLTTFPNILTTTQCMDAITYKGLLFAPSKGYFKNRNGNSYIQPSYPQQSYPQSFHDESTRMEIKTIRNNQPNKKQNNRPPQAQQRNRFQQQPPQVNVAQQFAPRPKLSDQQRDYLRRNNGCFYCRRLGHNRMNCPVKAQNRPQLLNNIQNDGPGNVQQRA